ncbi:phage tail tube protein [Devosia aurantiaca]|uniref:Uncharacterized protein n=1 Tax=Devosia aurantiaca TaxID=2714858 RepID=A0A6M1T279_9HYPH|nr:phage tail tube protein [Devosia aurantiaca]NGP18921.1 hypothetical protein [Devosia aurantiaca]
MSNEIRRDGLASRGRHGSRSVSGQYVGDLSLGTFDELIEAAFRGTFAPTLSITEATAGLTSITTTTSTIVASAGSWIAAGLRVGDVIRLTGHSAAENNDRNLRVTGLTASTITVAETLTAVGAADTAFGISRPKKLLQGLVARSFTFEEHEADIDGSEVFTGVRVGGMQLQMQPNGMCVVTFDLVGRDMQVMTGAQSPYYAAPAEFTSIAMTAVEAKIRVGSGDVLDITSLDLNLNLNASGVPVVGSVVTPEVFTNTGTVEGSITALKQDVSRSQQYLNETELSLHLLFEEQETGAADFCSFYLGNLTLGSATKGEIGTDNGRTQTFSLLTGADQRGGAFDRTTLKFQTSAT